MHDAPQSTAPIIAAPIIAAPALTTAEWQARAQAHLERVQRFTQPRRDRRARGASHPVHDFLFQYYSYSPGKLETWHPAAHEALVESVEALERFTSPVYAATGGVIRRQTSTITAAVRERLTNAQQILRTTHDRPAHFGCYGMHEWAMVYRGHDLRHAGIAPLRLPQAEVDALVETRPVACSHFDAFRFFAPDAKPINRIALEWSTRYDAEQPGCIHANMDLYRWAYTCMPWTGSDLLADCFELAMDLRDLDMQAGPYDLRSFGVEPVCIETAEGRDEYQRRQRALSARSRVLRTTLIEVLASVLDSEPTARASLTHNVSVGGTA